MQPSSCPFDGTALIVEDHPLYSDALAHLMRIIFARGQVVEAASAEIGLRIASALGDLRLVLLDFRLSGLGGVEAISAFQQKFPLAQVVVISASEDRREATAAICAGAKAFVSKAASMETLNEVIQDVLAGKVLKTQWISSNRDAAMTNLSESIFTPRQQEILCLLSQGHSNKEISLRLDLALVTIKNHVSAIFRTLGVVNRTQAVLASRRMGLYPDKATPSD